MYIAFIAPPKLTWLISQHGSALMGLAHLILKDSKDVEGGGYVSALRSLRSRRGDHLEHTPLIVNSGQMECGRALDIDDIKQAAEIVGADEIVMPDAFKDSEKTLNLLRVSLPAVKGVSYSLMAVPQGRTSFEWLECFMDIHLRYIRQDRTSKYKIHTIGIPKVVSTFAGEFRGREYILDAIEAADLHKDCQFHLLGVWNDMYEVIRIAKRYPWMRSCDTSLPVYSGLGFKGRPEEWDNLSAEDLKWSEICDVVVECNAMKERIDRASND